MEQESSFGELLKHFRKSYDWTQAEVADRFGYSEETIKSWEQGRRFPAREEVLRLADLMELDVQEVKDAIRTGRSATKPSKIASGNVIQVVTSSSVLTHYAMNNDILTFLEDEIHSRWELYRTGGSSLASRGLAYWLSTTETTVQEIQGSIWQPHAMALLNVMYQLEGSICTDLMQYKQAHAAYKKAFRVALEQNDSELMASALARRGVTYIQQGRPISAISYLNHATTLTHDLPVQHLNGYLLKAVSEAYAMTHQPDESLRSVDLAEYVLSGAALEQERSNCQVNIASVLAQKGVNEVSLRRYRDALVSIDQSLKHYHPAYIRGRARLLAEKAEAFCGLRQIEESINLAEEAYSLAAAVGSRKTIERLQKLYIWLLTSHWRKEAGVVRLGALLAMK